MVLDLVAVGQNAADEVAVFESGLEVPLDSLLNRLAFPLAERNDQVHDEFAHRRGGVDEGFGNRREADLELLHLLVEVAEVLGASRHAVDPEYDDLVDKPGFALFHQPLVGRAFEVAAAVAVIVEPVGKGDPALRRLCRDEAFAHLPLRVD